MELKIRTLREKITQIIGEDLIKGDFKLDKSLTYFTKKEGKNKLKIFIDCYDYSPSRIEFRLIFQIWVHEIVAETEKFHFYMKEPFSKDWPTFSFCEGDFYSETKNLEHKFRNAYTHIITDASQIEKEVLLCKELLQKEVLPSLETFMNFNLFQAFVLVNYKNISQSVLTKPAIITMKLKGTSELKQFVDYLWEHDNFKYLGVNDVFKKYVDNIIMYSLQKENNG